MSDPTHPTAVPSYRQIEEVSGRICRVVHRVRGPDLPVAPTLFDRESACHEGALDGEPWFVLADVCRVLEIGNARMEASRLDPDERMTINTADGH